MSDVLKHCRVPWTVSPSGGICLLYEETDTAPICYVTFPASRISRDGLLDSRLVRIDFVGGAFTKTHWHDDRSGPESIGYTVIESRKECWPRCENWKFGALCPSPCFYKVENSTWIPGLPALFHSHHHFLIDGRDGCIEIIAERYHWKEWIWPPGCGSAYLQGTNPIDSGEGPE
ncbi:MAG: hypothetical protein U0930_02830 [Pirellulales bacterium]